MEGDEYASDVTHVQWNVYVIKKKVIRATIQRATSLFTGYEGSACLPFFDDAFGFSTVVKSTFWIVI